MGALLAALTGILFFAVAGYTVVVILVNWQFFLALLISFAIADWVFEGIKVFRASKKEKQKADGSPSFPPSGDNKEKETT